LYINRFRGRVVENNIRGCWRSEWQIPNEQRETFDVIVPIDVPPCGRNGPIQNSTRQNSYWIFGNCSEIRAITWRWESIFNPRAAYWFQISPCRLFDCLKRSELPKSSKSHSDKEEEGVYVDITLIIFKPKETLNNPNKICQIGLFLGRTYNYLHLITLV
jgi:hypothetical protein